MKVINVVTLSESEIEAKVKDLKRRGYEILYTQEKMITTGRFRGKPIKGSGFVTTAVMTK